MVLTIVSYDKYWLFLGKYSEQDNREHFVNKNINNLPTVNDP